MVDDIDLLLSRADGFDENDIFAHAVQNVNGITDGIGQSAQGTTRRQGANEYTRILGMALHANPVAEERAARKGACGINGQNADGFIQSAKLFDQAVK